MPDYKARTERHEKNRAAGSFEFYIHAFAKKFDISPSQAKRLVKLHGKHSGILVREAWKLKK